MLDLVAHTGKSAEVTPVRGDDENQAGESERNALRRSFSLCEI
jgi:hypothetical protein